MLTNAEMQTHSLVQMACRSIEEYVSNKPDWEQRRYEIARELFVRGNHSADESVEMADMLIHFLKKK